MRRRIAANRAISTANKTSTTIAGISSGVRRKVVKGRREEIIEAKAREHNRQHGRPASRMPRSERDGKQQERQFHVVEFIVLQDQRRQHGKNDRDNCKTIALDG